MDKVSPEILSLIVGHLFEKPRVALLRAASAPSSTSSPGASYACVSRRLQDAVEPHNFAHIRLKSSELPTLAALFSSSPYRRALLRRLEYVVCLPTHGDSRGDHARNVQAFRSAIRELTELLASWECGPSDGGGREAGRLELHLGFGWDINDDEDGPVDYNFDVCNSSSARRYLTLQDGVEVQGDSLPAMVRRVIDFKIDVSLGLAPHPTAICQLADLFPNVEGLDIEYRDPAIRRYEMRREHRVALANGLESLRERLPKLKKLCIRRQGATDPWNHGFGNQDLEEARVDTLCASVRQLFQAGNLTELELVEVLVSPDLFRDQRSGDNGTHVTFPALRRFIVKAGILAPSGKWYYTGNPAAIEAGSLDPNDLGLEDEESSDDSDDEDSGDEDRSERDAVANGVRPLHPWRTRPDTETFDPLVKSMAEAVLHGMPSLEWGSFEMGIDQHEPVGVIIQCCAAGQPFVDPPDRIRTNDPYPDDTSVRRWKAWIGLGTEWYIPQDVTALWEEWVGDEGKVETASWPPIRGG